MNALPPPISRALQEDLGTPVATARTVHGGDIHTAFRVALADGLEIFVKSSPSTPAGLFAAEAAGLRWLGGFGAVDVPRVVACRDAVAGTPGFLALDWIEHGSRRDGAAFGRALARLHGVPIDHPSLEPVWAAAQDHDLAVVLHTFTVMPPYAPGGLDTWENLWLQRSAAHPWCGMRNMAAMIGAGVMDRYPRLRLATLEAGHGWLPFWMTRIDEHAETIAAAIPELKAKPSEYVTSGRYRSESSRPSSSSIFSRTENRM
jgi:hypothetical protein